jgi:hypothetical protein
MDHKQTTIYSKKVMGMGPVEKERYRHYYSTAICSKPF